MKQNRILWVSFFVDVSDVVINVTIAFITGSVTMLTQALEGTIDLLASTLLLIGAHYAQKEPDKRHPFGYGRELYFWALLAMLSMFAITAVLSVNWGITRLLRPEPIDNIGWALVALGTGLFTNGYSSYVSLSHLIGKHNNLSAWQAFSRAADIEVKTVFVLDFMGTIASLLGIIALAVYTITGDTMFDALGAIAVGIALGIFSIQLIRDVKNLLVGQSASPSILRKIRRIVHENEKVERIASLRAIHMGKGKLLVALEINFRDHLDTDTLETTIDKLEASIRTVYPQATEIYIEVEG